MNHLFIDAVNQMGLELLAEVSLLASKDMVHAFLLSLCQHGESLEERKA